MSDLNSTKPVSLREAVGFGYQCDGQGYIKINATMQGPKMSYKRMQMFQSKAQMEQLMPSESQLQTLINSWV
jgi:hypothetical protein